MRQKESHYLNSEVWIHSNPDRTDIAMHVQAYMEDNMYIEASNHTLKTMRCGSRHIMMDIQTPIPADNIQTASLHFATL